MNEKKPSFLAAISVIIFLCVAIGIQVFVLKDNNVTHITLILACVYAAVVAMANGYTWQEVQDGILYGCEIAMLPMLILMLVGVLISSWIPSGTIPTLIYYGLQMISPGMFLATVAIVCSVASVATGSSYTTGATFGVAFMGIGYGLNIPAAMTAGAVISGAIFGDKMSPLSDSTNLAAGVAEADLFDHIRSMMYTTGPAFLISIGLYVVVGLKFKSQAIDMTEINIILNGLKDNYFISPLTIIPPIIVVILALKRVSGLAVMIIASIIGAAFAMIFQGTSLNEMLSAMNYGFVSTTGIEQIDALLSRGGLQSMMWTISLGFIGLSYGGILEKTRVLEVILDKISNIVSTIRGLVITHVLAGIIVNIFSASQYIAIIIPTRMLAPAYKKLNLQTKVLSRTAEDSATVTSPLIPWGLCGAFFTATLGVSTLDYLPYVFLSFVTPLIAILYAVTDKFMFREEVVEKEGKADIETVTVEMK